VLERLELARLRPHLINSTNFSKWQSAYRLGHSTETALLDVFDSVHTAADNKEVTLLIGLDLSAASDMVCHSTLTKWLQTGFGVSGTALSWIQSYMQDWTQFVKVGQHRSSETTLEVRVPLGLVTSSRPMASNAINTPMTLSSTQRCASTTQLPVCPFSPLAPLTSRQSGCMQASVLTTRSATYAIY